MHVLMLDVHYNLTLSHFITADITRIGLGLVTIRITRLYNK